MSEDAIQAVILAGGVGTRLKPYTELIPKPLVPISGMPVMEVGLRQLARFGFCRVVITVGHEADLIIANFSEGGHLGLNISYARETSPLGTAGPLTTIRGLAEDFLVLNGDLLTTLDLREFFEAHISRKPSLTIAAHDRRVPIEFGIIEGDNRVVTGYVEKPTLKYLVSMGVYAFNRKVLSLLEQGKPMDFPELVQKLLDSGEAVNYFPFDGYWLDIGCKEDYARALEDFPRMRNQLLGVSED